MKAKTKYLKATKVARTENLIFSGFNLSADFFTLTYSQLARLKIAWKQIITAISLH